VDHPSLRAGDADRQQTAERLRLALEEGRLNLHEYDERLRDAYAAKTYADLDALLADLPPASAEIVPAERHRIARATPRWVIAQWGSWARAVSICTGIWAVSCVLSGELTYFWPGWVAGPWGVVLLVRTIGGLTSREPQHWAAQQSRRRAEREVRRQIRRGE